ncbi:MAG: DUF938 domain-containing protein [Alphaproteobacteria bacterium]|nr:DUF938 domain-containing protein [Alphaproteobacteria bacterium]
MTDARRHAPATSRNRDPILAVLRRVLPPAGLVLEIASGSGEHAAYFAPALAPLCWQPSDGDQDALASIAAHAATAQCPSLQAPIKLDATAWPWPITATDAIVCINMIHISPWRAAEGLAAGAGRLLPPAGVLFLYGPFMRAGRHTAPSNEAFDRSLRQRDPAWGVRDVDVVTALAQTSGFDLDEIVEMPANNLSVVFRKR